MKKLIGCTLALFSVFFFSCEKDEESGIKEEEKRSFLVPVEFSSIQSAIDASANGDTIFVAPGTYKENINFNGKEVIVSSFEPDDVEAIETTIIDGSLNGTVVTFNNGETNSAVLTGFTIRNGDAGRSSNGGGVLIANASSPVIKNNIITNNTAQYGAGICVSDQSQPVIENNIFIANTAGSSRGAGIYVIKKSSVIIDNNIFKNHSNVDGVIHIGSTYTDESSAVISNNTIDNNTTDFGTGGIKVTAESTAEITNNTITNNTGSSDHSAAGITIGHNSYAVISDNIIADNAAKNRGAIVIYKESEAVITGNTISENSAGVEEDTRYGSGGGISVSSSKANISDNTISGNSAWNHGHGGGGIIISNSSEATINNNEILNNKAYRYGGGIYVRQNYNYVTITNNVISGNEADGYGDSRGGGVYLANIVEAVVYNNTISNNWAQRYGGGIYVSNNVEILSGRGEEAWIRMNYPPETEPNSDYINNTHGDDTHEGANAFFAN